MLTIMFVAIASVASLDTGPHLPDRIDRILTTKARDTLLVWEDLETGADDPCLPHNVLDRLVFDGLQEDHAEWDRLVEARYGPGFDVDLVLDNFDAIYPLHGSGTVVGSTAAIDWSRFDTYAMPITSVSAASGLERIRVDAPALHWGRLARPEGEAVRYGAQIHDALGDSQRVVWGLTSMFPGDDVSDRQVAAGLVVLAGETEPFAYHLEELQISPVNQEPLQLTIHVADAGGAGIPAGTILNVTFPVGWLPGGWDPGSLGDWEDISPDHSSSSSLHFVARALRDTSATTLILDAYAPIDSVRAYDIITARLSHGSLAEANLVVTYPADNVDRALPRVLVPSTPYGLRAGDSHVFGASFANGAALPATVTEFTMEIPGGYDLAHHDGNGAPLFAGIVQGMDADGSTKRSNPLSGWSVSSDGRRIAWKGSEEVDGFGAAGFWVTVRMPSDPALGTSIQPAIHDGGNVTLSFANGFEIEGRNWGRSPGIPSFVVPPATRSEDDPEGGAADGYPWLSLPPLPGSGLSEDSEYTASSVGATAHVERSASYVRSPGSADAVNLESAIANATFEVKTRKVPVGERMRVDGDLSSLFAKLAELGFDSTVTLDLYSPPTLGCFPTASWEIETDLLPSPAILDVLLWDVGLPATPSVFVATAERYLYRLDVTGEPVWALKLEEVPTSIAKLEPDGRRDLLVTLEGGTVLAVEAGAGTLRWSDETLAGQGAVAAYDAARGLVVAGGATTLAQIDATTGALVREVEVGEETLDVVPSALGYLVRTDDAVVHRDAALAEVRRVASVGPGLAWSDTVALVVEPDRVAQYSPDLATYRGATPLPFPVIRAARGLVTDDAVVDIALVLDDETPVLIDGATGAIAWSGTRPPPYTYTGVFPVNVPPSNDESNMPGASSCTPSRTPASYLTIYTCGEDDVGTESTGIAGGPGRLAMGVRWGQAGVLGARGDEWEDNVEYPAGPPVALDVGAWGAQARAIAVGTEGGKVLVYDDAMAEVFESEPADRVGQFSFYMIVPEGGFYGTHLLVARVVWNDGTRDLEAKLVDWFEVVQKDGTPAKRPHYRVALSVAARDGALE